jgi:hypothetical protein
VVTVHAVETVETALAALECVRIGKCPRGAEGGQDARGGIDDGEISADCAAAAAFVARGPGASSTLDG